MKEDRKRGILEGDSRRIPRKPSTLPDSRFTSNDPRRKKYNIENSNGFGGGNSSNSILVDGADIRWPQQNNQHINGHAVSTDSTLLFTTAVCHSQSQKVLLYV